MSKPVRIAWAVTPPTREGGKAFWTRIGAEFENRDGSTTIQLNALPTNACLVMRAPKADDQDGQERPSKDFNENGGRQ